MRLKIDLQITLGKNVKRRTVKLAQGKSYIAGREGKWLVIEDASVSKQHFEFTVSDNTLFVRDLESFNGLFLNGTKLIQGPIRSGDLLEAGQLKLLIMRIVVDRGAK
jgi:pSer/pThr/pTyr-binding forkhead associated (FHA) protein